MRLLFFISVFSFCFFYGFSKTSNDSLLVLETNTNKDLVEINYQAYLKLTKIPDQIGGVNFFCKCKNRNDSTTLENGLNKINYFRNLVGLDSVTLVENLNILAMESAFLMHKNKKLSHHPDKKWKCYNELRKSAAERSLLAFYNKGGYRSINIFFEDFGEDNTKCGHRRWLLWSNLQHIGYGKTSKVESVLLNFSKDSIQKNQQPKFISYPSSGYFPGDLIYERFSFSINEDSNYVDLSNIKLKVMIDGKRVNTKNIIKDDTFGDPSVIFEIENLYIKKDKTLIYNPKFTGKTITVEIQGIVIQKKSISVKYDIKPV